MPQASPIRRIPRAVAVALTAAALVAVLLSVAARPAAALLPHAPARATAAGGFSLSGSGHAPKAGRAWTAVVRGASGRVSLDVVFGGSVVGHVTSGTLRHGSFRHTVRWPARSVGYPLSLRATVKGPSGAVRLEYAVKVHR